MKNLFKICILFLCITTTIQAQEKTPNKNYILVNEGGCTNCTIKRSKSSLLEIRVSVDEKYEDLISYKVKIPGQSTIVINGSKSNATYTKAIKRAKIGTKMQIFDLKTKTGHLKSYIIIEITK